MKSKKRIAIFATGSGSNAEVMMRYFQSHPKIEVSFLLSNKPEAGVLQHAKKYQVPTFVFNRDLFFNSENVLNQLKEKDIDFIVLAGFLWKIPDYLIAAYPNRIINIHPALLPKFGGKGMYGIHVHEAVKAAGEQESGITIHLVNENYDEGKILLQEKVRILPEDNAVTIAKKVLQLEHAHFSPLVEKYILETISA